MPTAQVLNNLGLMYQRQGALDKARPLLERSLAIREQKVGPDHIDVARVLNNLAIVHQEKAELDIAERLYTRALAIYEKTLGPNHPLVGQTREQSRRGLSVQSATSHGPGRSSSAR